MNQLRIVSLIPSATEIVASLGLTDCIVGRSHECDYPVEVQNLPICTKPKFNPEGTSREIHSRVTALLQTALSVYQVDIDRLEQLQPTHILTQAQCEVCACSLAEVQQAVSSLVRSQPQIVSLQPNCLAEIWADIQTVADALGTDSQSVIVPLQSRVEAIAQTSTSLQARPSLACIEWIDPLMAAGNWIPELVAIAGGQSQFGVAGKHSPWLKWQELVTANPDLLILMPCGFDLPRTRLESQRMTQYLEWEELQAVNRGNVYLTDGNAYFNRPGPRLVDSLEILAEIIHPNIFNFGYEGRGWERLSPLSVPLPADN